MSRHNRQVALPLVTPEHKERERRTATPVLDRKFYDARLHEMLRWKRPHGSKTEQEWVSRFIMPYQPVVVDDSIDALAYIVVVPLADGGVSKTLFSSHVDTVHRIEGRQKITFNIANNHYGKNDDQPLGADCAAGVWLMLEMIDRKVPGAYFFHRGEEAGGIGSDGVAQHYSKILAKFERAVAFDRKDTWSVITHQWGGRCCSDIFGNALADQLNEQNRDFMYAPDDSGLFTDTANYTLHIPECTNVSVGYYDEHTPRERLDLAHLFALRDALVGVKWEELPVVRDPLVVEDRYDDRFNEPVGFTFKPDAFAYPKGEQRGYKQPDLDDLRAYKLDRMTYAEMQDMAYQDTELFIQLVRYELMGEVPAWAKLQEQDDYWTGGYNNAHYGS